MPIATINDSEIYYEIQGEGAPLLMLPGLGTGGGYYALGEPLLRRSFQTILVDPRGIGRSDKRDADFSCEAWADDFAALIDHLGLGPVHVLGSSLGGCMALALAERHPDKLRTLIPVGAFTELGRALAMNFRLRVNMLSKLGLGQEMYDHVALWTMRPEFLDSPAGEKAVNVLLDAVKMNTVERYIALCETILRWGHKLPGQEGEAPFTERLPSINLPTLVVTGDSDHMIPTGYAKIIAEGIPGARYVEIPQCGHIPFLEKPEIVCGIVTDFLNEQ